VMLASEQGRELEPSPLKAASEHVHLPYQKLPSRSGLRKLQFEKEGTVRPQERSDRQVRAKVRNALQNWAETLQNVLQGTACMDPVFAEVQAMRIGGLCMVAISGEPFFEIGERIRHMFPSLPTWTLGYCNTYSGYIPTRKAFREGGYEVSES